MINIMKRSKHFIDMMKERNICKEWVERCKNNPDLIEDHNDGTRHYIKKIPEFENRWLRVIVNINVDPNKEITVFFDRRLRAKYES